MPGNSSVGSGYAEKWLQSYDILSTRPNSRPVFFVDTPFLLNFASVLIARDMPMGGFPLVKAEGVKR